MAEWFVGPVMEKIVDTGYEYLRDQKEKRFFGRVIEKIIDMGFEYLKGQVRWQKGLKEELQKLQEIYPEIQRVVTASSQSQIRDQNPALNRWLWQLRDVVEEADDLLDEFEYLKQKEHLTQSTDETKGKKRCNNSYIIENSSKFRKVGERGFKMDPNLNRLKNVVQNLVNVSADVAKYSDLFENISQMMLHELNDIRETGALPTNNFIGRWEEMEFIMHWLRNSPNEDQSHITSSNFYKNISLLSIVGHGGMGKTTLSQHAYDNEITNKFDVKMWVCVSTNFDVKRVIAGMLESHKESKCDLDTLEGLQLMLKSEVDSKKFLLVLDDIWEDEEKDKIKWENIFTPLASGSLGSKILITTRAYSVGLMIANILGSKDHTILRLEGLKEDECLQLLSNHVFATLENPDAHKKSILQQIVKKVFGSPLAAKVIGGVLSSIMDERHWIRVLKSDFVSIEQSQNIFFPVLRLSYMFLPKPLQSCFSFCSIFPQDHEFDKDDLIRMWIVLNFIQPSSNTRETLEDIGERYFDILVKKSFFEMFRHTYTNSHITYYKMHDLLHELAQFVSSRECCRVVGDEELSNYETIRHLSVQSDDLEVLRKIKKFKKLRSLFLSCQNVKTGNHKDVADVLSEIFEASSSIRLLLINVQCQIPEKIGDLIHLRYLNYKKDGVITELPRSICTLYHMNFIIYRFFTLYIDYVLCDFLPRDMNNLFNLRYVELPWHKLPKMHWIGKLRPLQRLNNFFVKNDAGYRINELEHMNELCELRIYQLENVKDAEEACSAKLCDKGSLTELSLHWDGDSCHRNMINSNLDEEVFDNLQPHNNLKRLMINAYMGTRSARWMNDVKIISNLECIKLEGCLEWQTLPPLGKLHFLKSLYLRKMPRLKSFDYGFHRNDEFCAFPSLEVLHIEDLDALEDWFDAATVAANDSLFPCLTELWLESCPNLQVLPSLPTKLQYLKMVNIRWKGFSWLQDTSNCNEVDIQKCGDFPGIFTYWKTTTTKFIRNKLSICDPSELLVEPLRSITSVIDLTICENDKLVSFPIGTEKWFLQVSSSLCKLNFMILESLQSLPSFLKSLSSLEELSLCKLKSLQCLSSLSNIFSLKRLSLEEIPLLTSLLDLPSCLENLSIENLELLECLPSSLSTSSSLKNLKLSAIPLLKSLPGLPPSLEELFMINLESLECLPSSLSTFSSLNNLKLSSIPLLKSLPDLPPSLEDISIENLESLECLPYSSSTFSSLKNLKLSSIPLLKSLPNPPPSLEKLSIQNLESLECPSSSLSTLSSLKNLKLSSIPLLTSFIDLPFSLEELFIINLKSLERLPSSLSTFFSLKNLELASIPLKSLPVLPPSLEILSIHNLESSECLPSSLSTFSSLKELKLASIPMLKSLPVLPPSLEYLSIKNLESLECLPSSLSTVSSLKWLSIEKVPLLQQLPDLPSSLESLYIEDCHEELRKRYDKISGFDRDKLAHIPRVKFD